MAAKWSRTLALLVFLNLCDAATNAAVLYERTFDELAPGDPINLGTSSANDPNYVRSLTSTGGVGDSPALMFTLDESRRSDVSVGFGPPRFNGQIDDASDSSPIGGLSALNPWQILFSVDIKSVGNISTTPITLRMFQYDLSYEADRGIDANGDGDMVDPAYIYQSVFKPAVISGAGFTTASFTMDMGLQTAFIAKPFTLPPSPQSGVEWLTPAMDPTVPLSWSVSFGSDGYGNDNGNEITFDNIRVELIPEPSAVALASTALCVASLVRRLSAAYTHPTNSSSSEAAGSDADYSPTVMVTARQGGASPVPSATGGDLLFTIALLSDNCVDATATVRAVTI